MAWQDLILARYFSLEILISFNRRRIGTASGVTLQPAKQCTGKSVANMLRAEDPHPRDKKYLRCFIL